VAFCAKCGTQIPDNAAFCPSCGFPTTPGSSHAAPQTGFNTVIADSRAQEYWVRRVVAFAIDAALVYLVIGFATGIALIPAWVTSVVDPGTLVPNMSAVGSFISAISGLILVAYFTFAESSFATTLGKAIMGLRVERGQGNRTALFTSFLRNISKVYWIFLLLDVVVGLATSAGYRQKLSDRYLGTQVVPK
jgi:uncharacterized RDD family membrane protein YckC